MSEPTFRDMNQGPRRRIVARQPHPDRYETTYTLECGHSITDNRPPSKQHKRCWKCLRERVWGGSK